MGEAGGGTEMKRKELTGIERKIREREVENCNTLIICKKTEILKARECARRLEEDLRVLVMLKQVFETEIGRKR